MKNECDPIINVGRSLYSISIDDPVIRTIKGSWTKTSDYPNERMELAPIANELARFFALARQRYTGLKIGSIPNFPNWDFTSELRGVNGFYTSRSGHNFLGALEAVSAALKATGDRLDFVQVDNPYNYYIWRGPRNAGLNANGAANVKALQQWCGEHGVPFVLVVNTEERGGGNKAYHDMVLAYIRALRRDGVFPDGFLLQSWYDKPDVNLPETTPGTFANTVRDAACLIRRLFPEKK